MSAPEVSQEDTKHRRGRRELAPFASSRLPVGAPDGVALAALVLCLCAACGGDDDDAVPRVDAGVDAAPGGDAAVDAAADAGIDAGDPCLGRPGPDRLTRAPLVEGLTGARVLASDGTTALVCGAGFVQAIDLATGAAGPPLARDGTCRGAAVDGARAALTTSEGEVVLYTLAAGAVLTEDDGAAAGGALGGLLFADDLLLVAAGPAGVLPFDVSAGALDARAAWTAAADARSLAPAGAGRVALADGDAGAALLDAATGAEVARLLLPTYDQILVDPDAPGGVRDVVLPFEADSIAASDDWLLVGCGAYGYVRATRDGDVLGEALRSPTPFGRPPGVEGVVRSVALHGDELLYADGLGVVRLGLATDGALSWIGREVRPGHGTLEGAFWAAVDVHGDEVLALSTEALYRLTLGAPAPAPTLDLGRESLFVQATAGEEPGTVILQLGNLGGAELAVRLVSVAPPATLSAAFLALPGQPGPDEGDASCLRVPPGPNVGAVEVAFAPTDAAPVSGLLSLETNDPDAPTVQVPVRANPDVLAPGDPALDFALVALDGTLTRLSALAGDVVLLKFFNFQ